MLHVSMALVHQGKKSDSNPTSLRHDISIAANILAGPRGAHLVS